MSVPALPAAYLMHERTETSGLYRMSHGIFGGMTERRRRPMLAAREAGAA
jgi:hypothetical protein